LEIDVRYANLNDKSQIAELIARLKILNEELDPHFKTVDELHDIALKYIEESLGRDNVLILVAYNVESGEIAGVIRVEILDRLFYNPRIKALITDIYIKPRYRGRRVATLLLEKVKDEVKKRGAGILVATYPANNLIADKFYEKAGFKILQVERYIPL